MTTQSNELINRPGYLAESKVEIDNADFASFVKPSRIKIIQAQTGAPLKPMFKDGDIIIVPQLIKIGDLETPFTFVPIHFFPSWICLNPIQMKGMLSSIREYSLDPETELAKRCKTFAKVKCPENGDYFLNFRETLNFMIVIEGLQDWENQVVQIFFAGGEYVTGREIMGLVTKYKAPRYSRRIRAASALHQGKKGTWYGLNVGNDPQPWVSTEQFFVYEEMYKSLKKLVDDKTLDIDTSDVDYEQAASNEF